MRNKLLIHTLLLSSVVLLGANAYAGVVVGGTRVVYDGSKRETSLSVKNPDTIPYLIQAWADSAGPTGENKGAAKPPFIITPPLFRLDAGKENMVRIVRAGGDLPADRESVFWMNTKSIPASKHSDKNVLQISIKTRIKLFYRPAGLKAPTVDDYQKVSFSRAGAKLDVTNPTPYYLSFSSLKAGSTDIDTTNVMVPPKGHAEYSLPGSVNGNNITWQVINDFGGPSKAVTSIIK
ncbi:fimbrial biogenesis chaperone [Rahnella victoriana]|uniref:fimbrial biogenesis chaperone n=1 Tax=Rahnella victoriana TaxID=1510570 RepID=UPI001E598038|nr:molecular chaperone [Rahnella victoriana]UHM93647.1 molecular chaperone [Rahnella victoriana]